jgi:tRNA (cmo5U34)-methyltransferase
MTDEAPTYRWNTSAAAEAYDQAGPAIHPFYEAVQNRLLESLPFAPRDSFVALDLGAGSGRLAECLLGRFVNARIVLIDQSEPFLALAERRLQSFAPRVTFIRRRLQDEWAADLPVAPNVIVSTSAIHHLDPAEKLSLFRRCFEALTSGGAFINGDEYRPAADDDYLGLLEKWSAHMYSALDEGRIPESFRQTLDYWSDRNIRRIGEPKTSGDDCHETIATQLSYLRESGFITTEIVWEKELWAAIVAGKLTRTSSPPS